VVVKPTALARSRGVRRVDDHAELADAYAFAAGAGHTYDGPPHSG
jgi:biotin carboxylase